MTSRDWDVVSDGAKPRADKSSAHVAWSLADHAKPLPDEQQLPEEFHPREIPRMWKFTVSGVVSDADLVRLGGNPSLAALMAASIRPVGPVFEELRAASS